MAGEILFQFLIGILKTYDGVKTVRAYLHVSIPYRYSKNMQARLICCWLIRVSIPYRYSKNT